MLIHCCSAISLYIISTITYACFYWKEIAKNGHYTVAGISIIGILAIFYSPLSLDSFFPYVPVCVTVALLVTGYVVPRIREFFGPDDESTRSDEMTAMYTREASLDLESLTPLGDIRDLPWDPLAVSYMGDHSHTDHSIPGIPSSAGSVSSGEDDNNSSIESANTESRFSS
ncbi:hypothetical protein G7Y89_g9029 [Cudoniella acicularis]|uniref:Uncharacterized protein n=1 Tax=Cudoniella acicularis TaxID=354080 RepID=A0A8H4RFF6_9HELO|nr:hypothetical protein G7Y89_g9029 [Cudoniella acicularis]